MSSQVGVDYFFHINRKAHMAFIFNCLDETEGHPKFTGMQSHALKTGNILERSLIGSDVAYRVAAIPIILSGLQSHSPISRLYTNGIFTARRSYASAVLGVVILSVCPSVRPSLCMYVCMYDSIYNAPLLQPKQSRVRAHRPNRKDVSLACCRIMSV